MRILHITDLHYSASADLRQDNLINSLLENVKNKGIDFVIFSGDLVYNGSLMEDFNNCQKKFIEPLLCNLGLDYSQIFLCPGNHDVNRDLVSESVFQNIDSICDQRDTVKLNKFLENKVDFQSSKNPLGNYEEFFNQNYASQTSINEYFYKFWEREIEGKKIGFVGLNSSWRAIGENDEGNLVMPDVEMKNAMSSSKHCDIKIIFLHHPLRNFRLFNTYKNEDIIYSNFDLIISGHNHKSIFGNIYSNKKGIVNVESSACLSLYDDSELGYTIIDYNEEEYGIEKYIYNPRSEEFIPEIYDKKPVPDDSKKSEYNSFRRKLRDKYLDEEKFAKGHFLDRNEETKNKTFDDLFSHTILKRKSKSEVSDNENIVPDVALKSIINSDGNYYLLGGNKSGRTIFLKYVLLYNLEKHYETDKLPLYFNLKEQRAVFNLINTEDHIRQYYQVNKRKAADILLNSKLILLIDNFESVTLDVIERLNDLVSVNSNIQMIVCDKVQSYQLRNDIDQLELNYEKLYIHEMRRKHLVSHAQRMLDRPKEKVNQVIEKIENIFKKLAIPLDYWSVSLFLWIFRGNIKKNISNEVELIDLYIEELLGKSSISESSILSYDKYRNFLAYLAHFILTERRDQDYTISYSDLVKFTTDYKDKHLVMLPFKVKELINYIEDVGVMTVIDEDKYCFRLNGMFEYFIAYYMILDSDFKDKLISEKELFLSFGNEFQLYAGFKSSDSKFLEDVVNVSKEHLKPLTEMFIEGPISWDIELRSKLFEAGKFSELITRVTQKLEAGISIEERDELEQQLVKDSGAIMITNDNRGKKEFVYVEQNAESFEKILSILGGVFKNTDELSSREYARSLFGFILEHHVYWGFYILDQFKSMDMDAISEEDGKDDELLKLSNLLTKFIPTVVQSRLYESIGHANFEEFILDDLAASLKDPQNNQYRLFILLFLLTDINLEKYFETVQVNVKFITISVLKFSILIKLNFYVGFKIEDDFKYKKEIRKLIIQEHLVFDNKTDPSSVQKGLKKREQKRK